ncbi:hypothetical protein [Bradyrhizobium sp. NAS96.2]|nr:hypothetical protein [Bradyrhizobium sp. NAS96.2]
MITTSSNRRRQTPLVDVALVRRKSMVAATLLLLDVISERSEKNTS